MAVLPPNGDWLIQQHGGEVVLFHRHTEETLLRVAASDGNAMAQAQKAIHELPQLDAEQKSFAHFWFGYFYAHATTFQGDR